MVIIIDIDWFDQNDHDMFFGHIAQPHFHVPFSFK